MTKEVHYQFGGPLGTLALMVFLPAVVYGLFLFCGANGCVTVSPFSIPKVSLDIQELFELKAFVVFVAWVAFMGLLYIIIPGRTAYGVPLKNGTRLGYPMNGFASHIVALCTLVFLASSGLIDLTYPHKHFLQLVTAGTVMIFIASGILYYWSFSQPYYNIADHGDTGSAVHDYFIGRIFNPRNGNFDWKFFCELRPGLTGWVVLNLSCAIHQYQKLGHVSASMLLVNAMQFIYVTDATYNEEAILTTMDIATDGFGFMLAFGDLIWVPFTYTTQARYLVDHNVELPTWLNIVIAAIFVVGYVVFRLSNLQKHTFRHNPNHPSVRHLQTLKTETGSKLITSGWWGVSRHINYLGDWLIGLACCMACGFNHVIPYFYAIYFATLLIHRQIRDDEKCRNKYGADWDKYCELVPYKIVPYLY